VLKVAGIEAAAVQTIEAGRYVPGMPQCELITAPMSNSARGERSVRFRAKVETGKAHPAMKRRSRPWRAAFLCTTDAAVNRLRRIYGPSANNSAGDDRARMKNESRKKNRAVLVDRPLRQ